MENNKPLKIDVSLIPPIEMKLLAKSLLDYVKRFYKNPENRVAFEKWKAEQDKNKQ